MDSRLLLLTALLRGSLQPAQVVDVLGSRSASDALLEQLPADQREHLERALLEHGDSATRQAQALVEELTSQSLLDESLLATLAEEWTVDEAGITIDRHPAGPAATIDRRLDGPDTTIDRQPDAGATLDPGEHQRVPLQPVSDRQQDPHSVTRFLAEGGLGQVYVAEDTRLGREVVLKQLQPEKAHNDYSMGRFLREAQVTGQLEHPNIVPIYGLGWDNSDAPYYTMKYVRGRTLGDLIADYHQHKKQGTTSRLALRELLEAFLSVCNAVAYSHTRKVVHRDLKPENIAVGEFGEVIVLDWGLAKLLGESEQGSDQGPPDNLAAAGQSLEGQVMGTPNYMPPEQARGEIDSVDARADIYSLGAILFHIVTGCPPRHPDPENLEQLISQVAAGDIPTLRQLDSRAPRELEAICSHAMKHEPADRYQQVSPLSDDIRQWLANEPVSVYPEPWTKKTSRWARNHKTVVTTAVSIAVVTLGILASATVFLSATNRRTRLEVDEANQEQDNFRRQRLIAEKNQSLAEQQRDIAQQATLENRQQLVRQHIARGMALSGEDRHFQALLWFTRAYEMEYQLQTQLDAAQQSSMEDHQFRIHNILARCPLPVQIWQPTGGAGQVRFSPSPTLLPPGREGIRVMATCDGIPNSPASGPGQARLWDAISGQPLSPPLVHDQSVQQLLFHHDGTLLATAAGARQGTGSARVWRVPSGDPAGPAVRQPAPIVKVALDPAGKLLATAAADGSARLWEIASGEPVSPLLDHDAPLIDIAFSPDGTRFLTAAGNQVQLWETASGSPLGESTPHAAMVVSAHFSSFRNGIVTILVNGNVLYSPSSQPGTRQPLLGTTNDATFRATATTINPRETVFATGDESGRIFIHAGVNQLRGDGYQLGSRIEDLCFSANGQLAVASTRDGHVVVLDPTDTTLVVPPLLHPHAVTSVDFSPDGRFLVTACRDGLVRNWDLAASIQPHALMKQGSAITAARFHPDGDSLVTSSKDGSVALWDLRLASPRKASLFAHAEPVHDCFLAADGQHLVTIHGNSASTWLLEDPSEPLATMQHGDIINDAHVGSDGALLVTSSADKSAAIWDLSSGREILRLRDHGASVRDAAISSGGKQVVTTSATPGDIHSSTVDVWNGTSGERSHPSTIIPGVVHSVRFLPAIPDKNVPARILTLTGSLRNEPGTARLWNAGTGEPVGQPMQHGDAITFVDTSEDGRQVLTGSRDTTARLWSTVDGSPLTPPLSHPASVLSCDIRSDGMFLVTGCKDGSTHVWDSHTGNPIQQGPRHQQPVRVISFGPDGSQVLSADDDGIVRFWKLNGRITDPEIARTIAQLISGHRASSTSRLLPVPPSTLLAQWQSLQPLIAEDLEVTADEQFEWLGVHGVAVPSNLWLSRARQHGQLIEASPGEVRHRLQRGYAYLCAGEYEKAMQDYLAAYEIDMKLATLTQYCYLAAHLGLHQELASTIQRMIPLSRSNSDKARLLVAASLLPDITDDYTPLLEIARQLSTDQLLSNVYVRRGVGAILLRSGDLAGASQIFRGTPTGDSRSIVALTSTFLFFALAEQKQDNAQAAATLARVAGDFIKRQPQLEYRKPGPLWFEYIGHQLLLREYQALINEN